MGLKKFLGPGLEISHRFWRLFMVPRAVHLQQKALAEFKVPGEPGWTRIRSVPLVLNGTAPVCVCPLSGCPQLDTTCMAKIGPMGCSGTLPSSGTLPAVSTNRGLDGAKRLHCSFHGPKPACTAPEQHRVPKHTWGLGNFEFSQVGVTPRHCPAGILTPRHVSHGRNGDSEAEVCLMKCPRGCAAGAGHDRS